MKFGNGKTTIQQLYKLTAAFGVAGTVWMAFTAGWRSGLAFFFGSLLSCGNLWLFDRLATGIEPGPQTRKPWQAGAFVSRYLIFLAAGYVIVNALGVSPLPVVLGLFVSTAAVLLSSLLELTSSLIGRRDA